jgi:hypothetical protein
LRFGTRLELDGSCVDRGGPACGGVPGFWFCATHETVASAPASSKHSEKRRENDGICRVGLLFVEFRLPFSLCAGLRAGQSQFTLANQKLQLPEDVWIAPNFRIAGDTDNNAVEWKK